MADKINVTMPAMPPFDEYCEEIKSIWDTVWLTNCGPKHNELAGKVKDYLGVQNIELFVNGHLALYCALSSCLDRKGEIITTPFTFASTTNAIIQAGHTPVFCDVKDDYTIDEEKIESLITEKTVAILGVHVYGNACNVYRINEIAKKHGITVLYDAAHAFGEKVDGVGIGNFGDISMFSFHATKVFHSIEGGCLTFADKNLSQFLSAERNFGIIGEELAIPGTNAKMNEFQASMGLCNLRHLKDETEKRKAVFERYDYYLKGEKGIITIPNQKNLERNYSYYPVLIDKNLFGESRDDLKLRLEKENIFTRKYFYPLTSQNGVLSENADDTPKAKYFSENVLCLPMYSKLENKDIDRICRAILKKDNL